MLWQKRGGSRAFFNESALVGRCIDCARISTFTLRLRKICLMNTRCPLGQPSKILQLLGQVSDEVLNMIIHRFLCQEMRFRVKRGLLL